MDALTTVPSSFADMGRSARMANLFHAGPIIAALDDRLTAGARGRLQDANTLAADLAQAGCLSALCHPGTARLFQRACIGLKKVPQIILAGNAATARQGVIERRPSLLPAEAVASSAVGMCLHLNVGARDEAQTINEIAALRQSAQQLGLLLMVAAYPRPDGASILTDPEATLHALSVACEIGADIVKIPYLDERSVLNDARSIAQDVKVLVAGGSAKPIEVLAQNLQLVLEVGLHGMCVGRNLANDCPNVLRAVQVLASAAGLTGQESKTF